MRHRLLNIDVYDADSHFLFCSAKLPMYDALRQQKPAVERIKKLEACAPEGPEFRAELKVAVRNVGHKEKEYFT